MENNTLTDSTDLTLETAIAAKDSMNNTILEAQSETDEKTTVIDKDEEAAYFIHMAHKEFRRLAFALADRKKHSVSRVLEAVLFEPLEEVKLQGKAEEELFAICKQVMYNKGVVLQYAYNRAEKLKKGELNE